MGDARGDKRGQRDSGDEMNTQSVCTPDALSTGGGEVVTDRAVSLHP